MAMPLVRPQVTPPRARQASARLLPRALTSAQRAQPAGTPQELAEGRQLQPRPQTAWTGEETSSSRLLARDQQGLSEAPAMIQAPSPRSPKRFDLPRTSPRSGRREPFVAVRRAR